MTQINTKNHSFYITFPLILYHFTSLHIMFTLIIHTIYITFTLTIHSLYIIIHTIYITFPYHFHSFFPYSSNRTWQVCHQCIQIIPPPASAYSPNQPIAAHYTQSIPSHSRIYPVAYSAPIVQLTRPWKRHERQLIFSYMFVRWKWIRRRCLGGGEAFFQCRKVKKKSLVH